MKSSLLCVLALAAVAAGCKTTGSTSGLKDDSGAQGCYSSFASPVGSGETFEVWAGVGDASQLTNVQQRYATGRGDPTPVQAVGAAPAVTVAAITADGTHGLRAYFKSPVTIDPSEYGCFDVGSSALAAAGRTSAQGGVSYFCLAKAADATGAMTTLWVTNLSGLKFVRDLTVYKSTCTAAPST